MGAQSQRLWIAGVLLLALFSIAAAPPPTAHAELLEVWLDGHNSGRVARVTAEGDALFLSAADFADLRLALPAPPRSELDVAHLPVLTARLDEANQRLLLTVAADALPLQRFDAGDGAAQHLQPQAASGAILRYDISGTMGDVRYPGVTTFGGANLGLDIFTPDLLFSSTAYAASSVTGASAVRLDTMMRFDDSDTLRHLVLGDTINGAPAYARPVRFGGIQYASDFSLRPGLVTQPLPSFFGHSAVPATVDVYSGAAKLFEQSVEPGPFQLTNLPVLTGGGAATIVTTDVLGRQTSQSIALYTDAGLLAPGLDDFSFDAGFLRRGYGEDSFDYGAPQASFDWRHGITETLTLEAHGQAASHLALIGGGGEIGLGFGSLGASLAASSARPGNGWLADFSAQGVASLLGAPVNLYARFTTASVHYRDLASLDGDAPPRQRVSAGMAASLFGAGTFGLGFVGDKEPGDIARNYLSASWSRGLPGGAFAALTALQDFSSHATGIQFTLSVPLGGGAMAGFDGQSDNGRLSGLASFDKPVDPDGGTGWHMLAGWQDGARAEADGVAITDHAGLEGGASLADGRVSLRAGVSGAFVLLRGSVFAVHDPGDAVALVETGDPGIHVTRENRDMGISDGDGEKLLTNLSAYAPNHLGVDARDFAFDALALKTDAVIAPRRHSGVVVDFTPISRHPVLAMISRGVGIATPAGARVMLDGSDAPLPLGHDGELFLPDLEHGVGATVDLGKTRCRVFISPAAAKGPMPRTPPLLCLRETQVAY